MESTTVAGIKIMIEYWNDVYNGDWALFQQTRKKKYLDAAKGAGRMIRGLEKDLAERGN